MRRISLAAAAAATLLLGASQAAATTFTGSWSLDYNDQDPGLVIEIVPINQSFSFTLAADDPLTVQNEEIAVIPLFKIYTDETTVNAGSRPRDDDDDPKPITLSFTFSAPLPNDSQAVAGITGGVNLLLFQWGYLDWAGAGSGGSTALNFGVGDPRGLLSIGVNGGVYNKGLFGLDEGPGKGLIVYGTFDWDRDAVGVVPEPGAWALMIAGFGLAGATLRRRRAAFA